MTLDSLPWMEESKILYLTQNNWIPKHNEAGKVMASVADYYILGKSGDEALLRSVQEDFENWVMTSTRIIYSPTSLNAEIIDYYGSTVIEPVKRNILVPDYSSGNFIKDVINTDEGLRFFQGLFLTKDEGEAIMDALEKLGNKNKDNLRIWTPSQGSRNSNPVRAASLDCNNGLFHIYCYNIMNNYGRSRAVQGSEATASGEAAKGRVGGRKKNSGLPFNLESQIDKTSKSVCFSNLQEIGNFNKYTAIFCFYGKRYVLSAVFDSGEVPNLDSRVAKILCKDRSTAEKLEAVEKFLHPVYAHLSLYSKGEALDDVEAFEDIKAGDEK
ncbi:MAG: hypothetical protein ABIB71_04835 [Candidatus Woesearchaeota archaeon]